MKEVIAFFDLDKTILSSNSASGWLQREFKEGHLGTRQLLWSLWYLTLYNIGKKDVSAFLLQAAQWTKGESEQDFIDRIDRYWKEEVFSSIRSSARMAIAEHQAKGHRVVLLSSALEYLGQRVAMELNIPEIECNQLLVCDGVFTGRMREPLCFGEGKIAYARRSIERYKARWEHCYFYTDSYSDLPLLERIGFPVAVTPDPRLKTAATQRGWTVEMWED